MKEKFFIVSKYVNRIAYRSLSPFEKKNPSLFDCGHIACDTWAEAHAMLLDLRRHAVERAKKELASTTRQLLKAEHMKEPA